MWEVKNEKRREEERKRGEAWELKRFKWGEVCVGGKQAAPPKTVKIGGESELRTVE